jgi:hypothetical protein
VAADGNNQLLPLAIAFADGENGDSWYWFGEIEADGGGRCVRRVCDTR